MKLLIKFPTRQRPEKAVHLLERYRLLLSSRHDVFFLVTVDADDATTNNPAMLKRLKQVITSAPRVSGVVCVGNSGTKVQAINADMASAPADWDAILLASDDMIPQVPAYDAIIFEHLRSHYPDLDGALWFNDGYTKKLCTLVVMGRPYYERFGYIYHPDYVSLWCDNEWTEVATSLGRLRYVDCTIIKHEHFANASNVVCDGLYKRNEKFNDQDRALYYLRKLNGFYMGKERGPVLLSILICSLRKRSHLLARVRGQLDPQITNARLQNDVEVLTFIDDGQATIGFKRNELVKRARGKWLCFVDDDDYVCDSYINLITRLLRDYEPDCVGITGMILWKKAWRRFVHSLQYREYGTLPGPVFVRPPNHLNPVRADIVRKIRFPEINRGEDTAYSMALRDSGLIKTERFIEDVVYFYEPSAKSDREGR